MIDIYALGTHSDWVASSGAWGKPGHQRIADFAKAAGISRLYWRTHDGGQACYPSKVCSVMDGGVFRDPNFNGYGTLPKSDYEYATHIDYSQWDQLADMMQIGAATGLEICQWYTFLEDDHGGVVPSAFFQNHPEYCCTVKSGERISGCLDFWYPEVREYKLAIIRELLQRPGRRLLLDFLRRNGIPSADAAGHFRYGYNPEILAGFRGETGLDASRLQPGTADWEAWLDYNARPLTEFVRAVHQLARSANIPLDVHVWPVRSKEWLAFDLREVAREGLIEDVLVGSQRYAVSATEARRQAEILKDQLDGSEARVVPGMFGYNGLVASQVDEFITAAVEAGCPAVALHESNQVLASPISDCLKAWSLGLPHCERQVYAARTPQVPAINRGFIRCYGAANPACDQETQFTVTYTDGGLVVEVRCAERSPGGLIPVPDVGRDNYNGNELGARVFWNPYESVHLFLDAAHSHVDYLHFVLDPENQPMTETRLDERWSGPWEHEVGVAEDHWTAIFRIPWATLGVTPKPGLTLGFQLVRVQNSPREVSSWFHAYARSLAPVEFGHLTLD